MTAANGGRESNWRGEGRAKLAMDCRSMEPWPRRAWISIPGWISNGRAGGSGGYVDATATFTTSGNTIDEWLDHLQGSARLDAGPAEVPIDQVERWSKGLLKFVFSLPAEGAVTRIHCIGGAIRSA